MHDRRSRLCMNIPTLRQYLDDSDAAGVWLCGLGIVDVRRAHGNLLGMAAAGVPLDLLAVMCGQLERHLPGCADPDMALNNLERFVRAARNPLAVGTLFERDPQALPTLLQIFATSQYLSDLLVTDPGGLRPAAADRGAAGRPAGAGRRAGGGGRRAGARCGGAAGAAAVQAPRNAAHRLRRHRPRAEPADGHHADLRSWPTRSWKRPCGRPGESSSRSAARPSDADGRPARFVVLGLGKLGGLELNYSSDIDLIFLCENDGQTDGARPISNLEFFDLVGREIVRLLTERTELGGAYRVDLRLRPEGQRGPMVMGVQSALELLRQPRPHLGAAGLHQGPARGRRPVAGHASFSKRSRPGSIAAT